jgi:hypothetical protein
VHQFVLTDETGWIIVDVYGKCGSTPTSVQVSTGEQVVVEGTVVVSSQGSTMNPVVKLNAQTVSVRQLTN